MEDEWHKPMLVKNLPAQASFFQLPLAQKFTTISVEKFTRSTVFGYFLVNNINRSQ